MPEAPKIYNAGITDTEQGVVLSFSLDEGLEETNEQFLWCRARIQGSTYYQPLDLNIMPGGKSAEAIVEPGKVQLDGADNPSVDVEWYFEQYPSREKSELVKQTINFKTEWFDLPAFERELRGTFERIGIESQAQEAARFRVVTPEEAQQFPHAALDNSAGLWLLEGPPGEDGQPSYAGIAPDQPDMGYAWRAAWIPQVLERSRVIRTENGWDDDLNH